MRIKIASKSSTETRKQPEKAIPNLKINNVDSLYFTPRVAYKKINPHVVRVLSKRYKT